MTEGQNLGVSQLQRIADASNGQVELIDVVDAGNGLVLLEISLSCRGLKSTPSGLSFRSRERFSIYLRPDFPFQPPFVRTSHTRFAGAPHVQWARELCLYAAPSVEWDVSDGMFGFVLRLHEWIKAAARGELDPAGAPLHPPVAYVTHGPGHVVVAKADCPIVDPPAWFGTATLRQVSESRVDLVGWNPLWDTGTPESVAAAILLSSEMPFECPTKLGELFSVLEDRGVPREQVMLSLRFAALHNERGSPLYVVVGTPMRGISGESMKQHLAVWHIDIPFADGLRTSLRQYSSDPHLHEIGQKVMDLLWDWTKAADIGWCRVDEARPEITERRDARSEVSAFSGKSVVLYGCGALGGNVAKWLVRAGVRRLVLRDSGVVSHGILVRQVYYDRDIGRAKVSALADQLRMIRDDVDVELDATDLTRSDEWSQTADVVLDTTGSGLVLAKSEQRRIADGPGPVFATLAIDENAEHGQAVVVGHEYTGGALDALRQAKLAAFRRSDLKEYAHSFWPETPVPRFFPEVGCSSPTFRGSAVDISTLAASLLNAVAHDLSEGLDDEARAHFVTRHIPSRALSSRDVRIEIRPSITLRDPDSGFDIRISESAWKEMCAWALRSTRTRGEHVETGGVLFGELDESLHVIWVDEATGPPEDSSASAEGFVCGTDGIADIAKEKSSRTRGSVKFVGMWHTHPGGLPIPSPTDLRGMRSIVESTEPHAPRALMIILGGTAETRLAGARVFDREQVLESRRDMTVSMRAVARSQTGRAHQRIGLALSGGGSRAIAFHLGCLRALHDRGILENVHVVSSVSGGSIIGALYAYSQGPFEEFDRQVTQLLRKGLKGAIVRAMLHPRIWSGFVATVLVSHTAAVLSWLLEVVRRLARLSHPGRGDAIQRTETQGPFRRWVSRTNALERALREKVVGAVAVGDVHRRLDLIINACDLRTGTAFRFGSRESGSWRYGKVVGNDIPVATAVAASAAYPPVFPALDRVLPFEDKEGTGRNERVLLTDGGVYDNLGVSALLPGRSDTHSTNVFDVDYILACDAGHGLFGRSLPYWWGSRMTRVFKTLSQRTEFAGLKRLHREAETGELQGFVLSYLGQQDSALPYRPPNLVPREEVNTYPTDFSPMRREDLDRLALRGEVLTRALIEKYHPEL